MSPSDLRVIQHPVDLRFLTAYMQHLGGGVLQVKVPFSTELVESRAAWLSEVMGVNVEVSHTPLPGVSIVTFECDADDVDFFSREDSQ